MTSSELQRRAARVIPGGVNSPVRSFKHVGVPPIFFSHAEGAMLTDVEGKRYVDFCLSFGPHILGHSEPSVVAALREQAGRATSFGACHPKEVELAELLLKGYPFLDRVRLVNSGTEAVMTAIRVARGFTGRDKIVVFEGCYHGHSDGLLAKAGSGVAALSEAASKGVPRSVVSDTLTARFDDLDGLKKLFAAHGPDIAAIVMEPIPANYGLWLPSVERIDAIVKLARSAGALVLFDEVISGFRVGLSGASGFYDQKPDLVTLGKVIGGGLPLAAIAGRADVMDKLAPLGDVYQAGTLSGNPLATAAGIAVLTRLFEKPPYQEFERAGAAFARELAEALKAFAPLDVRHVGSLFFLHFVEGDTAFPPRIDDDAKRRFTSLFKQALAKGIYFPPSPYEVSFLSTAHTPEVLAGVLEKLKGLKP